MRKRESESERFMIVANVSGLLSFAEELCRPPLQGKHIAMLAGYYSQMNDREYSNGKHNNRNVKKGQKH